MLSFGQSDITKGKYEYEICVYFRTREKPALLKNDITGVADTIVSMIRGKAYDFESSPLPFANVIFLNNQDNSKQSTITDSLGNFNINLLAGRYDLKVTSVGFKQFELQDMQVSTGQLRQIDVKLGSASGYKTYSIVSKKPLNKRKLRKVEKRLRRKD